MTIGTSHGKQRMAPLVALGRERDHPVVSCGHWMHMRAYPAEIEHLDCPVAIGDARVE